MPPDDQAPKSYECFKLPVKWTDYIYEHYKDEFEKVLKNCYTTLVKLWAPNSFGTKDVNTVRISINSNLTKDQADETRSKLFEIFIRAQDEQGIKEKSDDNLSLKPSRFSLTNEILLRSEYGGLVIGTGGQTIRSIRARCGDALAYIDDGRKNHEPIPDGYSRFVANSFHASDVQKVREELKQILDRAKDTLDLNNRGMERFGTNSSPNAVPPFFNNNSDSDSAENDDIEDKDSAPVGNGNNSGSAYGGGLGAAGFNDIDININGVSSNSASVLQSGPSTPSIKAVSSDDDDHCDPLPTPHEIRNERKRKINDSEDRNHPNHSLPKSLRACIYDLMKLVETNTESMVEVVSKSWRSAEDEVRNSRVIILEEVVSRLKDDKDRLERRLMRKDKYIEELIVTLDLKKFKDRCIACKTAERETMYSQCGHIIHCSSCADTFEKCPVCRRVTGRKITVKYYVPS